MVSAIRMNTPIPDAQYLAGDRDISMVSAIKRDSSVLGPDQSMASTIVDRTKKEASPMEPMAKDISMMKATRRASSVMDDTIREPSVANYTMKDISMLDIPTPDMSMSMTGNTPKNISRTKPPSKDISMIDAAFSDLSLMHRPENKSDSGSSDDSEEEPTEAETWTGRPSQAPWPAKYKALVSQFRDGSRVSRMLGYVWRCEDSGCHMKFTTERGLRDHWASTHDSSDDPTKDETLCCRVCRTYRYDT
jgi:hypothetical protein